MKISECKLCKHLKNAINDEYSIYQFCEFNNEDIKKIKACKYRSNQQGENNE